MDKALIGILGVAGILHLILVLVPVRDTLGASISLQSKLACNRTEGLFGF